MVIFHCYVSSPEGKPSNPSIHQPMGIWDIYDDHDSSRSIETSGAAANSRNSESWYFAHENDIK